MNDVKWHLPSKDELGNMSVFMLERTYENDISFYGWRLGRGLYSSNGHNVKLDLFLTKGDVLVCYIVDEFIDKYTERYSNTFYNIESFLAWRETQKRRIRNVAKRCWDNICTHHKTLGGANIEYIE